MPTLTWEYIGEELAIFWLNPYDGKKEKIANFWWPCHPIDKTEEVERMFEAIAANAISTKPEIVKPKMTNCGCDDGIDWSSGGADVCSKCQGKGEYPVTDVEDQKP